MADNCNADTCSDDIYENWSSLTTALQECASVNHGAQCAALGTSSDCYMDHAAAAAATLLSAVMDPLANEPTSSRDEGEAKMNRNGAALAGHLVTSDVVVACKPPLDGAVNCELTSSQSDGKSVGEDRDKKPKPMPRKRTAESLKKASERVDASYQSHTADCVSSETCGSTSVACVGSSFHEDAEVRKQCSVNLSELQCGGLSPCEVPLPSITDFKPDGGLGAYQSNCKNDTPSALTEQRYMADIATWDGEDPLIALYSVLLKKPDKLRVKEPTLGGFASQIVSEATADIEPGWSFKLPQPGQATAKSGGIGVAYQRNNDFSPQYFAPDSWREAEGFGVSAVTDKSKVNIGECQEDTEYDIYENYSPASAATEQELLSQQPLGPLASTSAKQLSRCGYLCKQGGKQNNKGWRKRYIVFDGKTLKYFTNEKSRIAKKTVTVSAMVNVESDIKESDTDRFRFRLKCLNRTYCFEAEDRDDSLIWTSLLMQAIIQSQAAGESAADDKRRPGGDMCDPDLSGLVRIDGRGKQFVAVKGAHLCYYKDYEDYVVGCPVHQVAMEIASVKEDAKCRLLLSTPYHQYVFAFDTDEETQSWKSSIEKSITTALSDDTVLGEVYENAANKICADCGGAKPEWAVLHLVVVVCKKSAGIHRQLWAYKVKSLRMDQKIWSCCLIKLFVAYGNGTANHLWESRLPSVSSKIGDAADFHSRQSYIQNKYKKKAYFNEHRLSNDQSGLDKALRSNVQTDNLVESMWLVHAGANVRDVPLGLVSRKTALELATDAGQLLQAEILRQTGADDDQILDIMQSREAMEGGELRVVVKTGFLDEVGKKESMRRWVVLDTKALSLHQDENMSAAKSTVSMAEVVSVIVQQSEKGLPTLTLTVMYDDGGRSLTLAATALEEFGAWTAAVYKVASPAFIKDKVDDFDIAGYAFMKEGTGMVWRNAWLCLRGKMLLIHDVTEFAHEDAVDVRKIVKINCALQGSTDSPAFESGQPLVINLPNRVLYVQSNLRQDTRAWAAAMERNQKNLTGSLEDQLLTAENIPVIVDKCIAFVSVYGTTMEGIYRLSGTQSVVTRLLELFMQDAHSVHLLPDAYSVHEVSNVCKRFLRNLADPLMTSDLYCNFLQTKTIVDTDDRITAYKELLKRLPPVNYSTLKKLIGHLQRLSDLSHENKMDSLNLATVFGPVLMIGSSDLRVSFSNTSVEIQVVSDLISNYQLIFEVDQVEINKERAIMEHIKRMQEVQGGGGGDAGTFPTALPEFLLYVYIGNNYGDCVNVKVSASMTATDLLQHIIDTRARSHSAGAASTAASSAFGKLSECAIFEVVCSKELERSLHPSEKVLDTTLSWEAWPEEQRRDNYLCVKRDNLSIKLQAVVGSDMARFSELDCYLLNGWKKLFCEFTRGKLTFYKDSKLKTHVGNWSVDDMTVYIGVEKKRKPPTKFGFTFLVRSEDCGGATQHHSSIFSRSVCYGSDDELCTWLSAISCAQKFSPNFNSASVTKILREAPENGICSATEDKKPSILKLPANLFKSIRK